MIVMDASVILPGLLARGESRELLLREDVHVPHLADPEVVHGMRRHVRRGAVPPADAAEALRAAGLPHSRLGTVPDRGAATFDRLELVPASLAKGLEFDHVVLHEPAALVAAEPDRRTGLRRLYVCLTRAVSSLTVVHAEPLPHELAA